MEVERLIRTAGFEPMRIGGIACRHGRASQGDQISSAVVNNRLPDRILELIDPSEASVGTSQLLVGVRGRHNDRLLGEVYLVG